MRRHSYRYTVQANRAHSSKWYNVKTFKSFNEAEAWIYENGIQNYTYRIDWRKCA